ncbi:MAG: hypothetical protein Kow0042_21230 [Calditrichia bacterium]
MNSGNQKSGQKTITRWDFFKVFLSSFFLQSVWNFRSLISVGFSICLLPILNKLYDQSESKGEFLRRHLKFFNAHPYFASYALGVSIKLEEMAAKGDSQIPELLDRLKNVLISPLGAVGDRLFWATVKPACLIFGATGILLFSSIEAKIVVLITTFLMYNIPHFYFRYHGIIEGYKHGVEIYKYISHQRFEKLRKIYLSLLLIFLTILVVAYSFKLFTIQPGQVAIFWLSAIYTLIFYRLVKNFYLVALSTTLFFIVVGILFF